MSCVHLVSVDTGKVPIEHHYLVRVDGQMVERVSAVTGEVDRHPIAPQPLGDGAGEPPVILDNQDSHVERMTDPR
jgi:hypothetical protein